jgi:hypothetical protein
MSSTRLKGAFVWSAGLLFGFSAIQLSTGAADGAEAKAGVRFTRDAAIAKLLPQCPTSQSKWINPSAPSTEGGFLLPLIAPLVGTAIEKGVSFSAQWLKKYQDGLSATSTAHDISTMYVVRAGGKLAARNGCLIFLRAELGNQGEFDKRVQAGALGKDQLWTASRLSLLRDGWVNERAAEEGDARRGRIAIVSTPLVYAEFAIRYNSNDNANQFTLKPMFFDYRATAAEREGAGNKDILFTITFERSDQSGSATSFAKYELAIPKTPLGARYDSETLADLVGRPQNLPTHEDKEKGSSSLVPIYVAVSLLETEKAGDLERLVAETFDENKDKLGAAISSRVQEWLVSKPEQK